MKGNETNVYWDLLYEALLIFNTGDVTEKTNLITTPTECNDMVEFTWIELLSTANVTYPWG